MGKDELRAIINAECSRIDDSHKLWLVYVFARGLVNGKGNSQQEQELGERNREN